MNFKIYDILSTLIPGFVIYLTILKALCINWSSIPEIPSIAIAFVLGYINNTLSSWFEQILFISWGGKPSDRLLDGKGIWKVSFYEAEKVKQQLTTESSKLNSTNDELFHIAMRNVNIDDNIRVHNFNESYAFSRSIFFSVLILFFSSIFMFWNNILLMASFFLVLIICWLRSKQRAYYFAREVLNNYLQLKITKEVIK